MPRTPPTGGPHVHVEQDEVAGAHALDSDVAQPVEWVDGARLALHAPVSQLREHAVGVGGHVDDVQGQGEAVGEVALLNELLRFVQFVAVDDDGNADGSRNQRDDAAPPAPTLQKVFHEK